MKNQATCKHNHPLEGPAADVLVGRDGRRYCRPCQRARSRAWDRRNPEKVKAHNTTGATKARAERAAYVAAYKLERGCADCGYRLHACALDLDHRDHWTKITDVAYLVSTRAAWPRLVAELEKCDVVCSNCHRVRTYVSDREPHPAHAFRHRPRPDTSVAPIPQAELGR